jgi:hypothetical protein
MSNPPPSSGYELIAFYDRPHGLHLGIALVRQPDGNTCSLDVYRDVDGLPYCSDAEALSVGNPWHQVQTALRAELRQRHPEFFLSNVDVDADDGVGGETP